ncbi:hypothetical protein [Priestia megaterium]|uniref:hypothetical protein n=1 Tax=Priestia megaterium TaxID=1404 RepID=UPI001BE90D21|nr:hypothetical protein [Priestia megaterium]MBT2254805.1 hypothetical protein [Priestia megaterium]
MNKKKQVVELQEKMSNTQKASNKRYESISNGLVKAYSQTYTLEDLTQKANDFLDGNINPKDLGVEKCSEFTDQCNSALRSLERDLLELKTSAGFSLQHGRTEQYKDTQQEIKNVEAKADLFKKFI